MRFCSQCGTQLEDTHKFCIKCGATVKQENAQPVQVGAQQAVPMNAYYPETVAAPAPVSEPAVYGVFSIIGMIGGIVSLVLSCSSIGSIIYSILGIVLGIPSLVFSAIGKKSVKHHGKAKAGFILSLIAVIIGAVAYMFIIIALIAGWFEGAGSGLIK